MIGVILILGYIIWIAISTRIRRRRTTPSDARPQDHFSPKQGGKGNGDDDSVDPSNEEQASWTALDDRQLERLLRDSAP